MLDGTRGSQDGCGKPRPHRSSNSHIVQSVASGYTDYANLAALLQWYSFLQYWSNGARHVTMLRQITNWRGYETSRFYIRQSHIQNIYSSKYSYIRPMFLTEIMRKRISLEFCSKFPALAAKMLKDEWVVFPDLSERFHGSTVNMGTPKFVVSQQR
jgi:hypothetical protein